MSLVVAAAAVAVGFALAAAWAMCGPCEIAIEYAWLKLRGGYSLDERLSQFGTAASRRLVPHFERAGTAFPPHETAIVVFKHERILELHARGEAAAWRFIRSYPVLAASGALGPKLKEGDRQVPEGIYRVTFLNPNSLFHVSLRLDYPNAFDRRIAVAEGRTRLGTDIMIHGKQTSAGCIAPGDRAIEELFVLAAATSPASVTVLISPYDFRRPPAVVLPAALPGWTEELHAQIRSALAQFPPRP